MIPFTDLCAALDRYNRRKQGLPVDEPARQARHAEPAPEPIADDAMVQEEFIGEVSGAVMIDEEVSSEEAPASIHEESTRELNADDIGDVVI